MFYCSCLKFSLSNSTKIAYVYLILYLFFIPLDLGKAKKLSLKIGSGQRLVIDKLRKLNTDGAKRMQELIRKTMQH